MKPIDYPLFLSLVCLVTPLTFGQATDDVPNTSSVEAWQLKVEFLSAEAGAEIIVGEEDDEFFARLHPREAAAMTGIPRGEKNREESQQVAREFFQKAILDFRDDEKAALESIVKRVYEKFNSDYPLIVDRPWRFIKTRRDLCGGFSFTRSDCILLSEPTLAKIIRASKTPATEKSPAESLLLHEQMHVLQRESPELLKPLYEKVFQFQAAKVQVHPWIDERQVTNPDGMSDDWVAQIREGEKLVPYWIGTVLLTDKPLHQMGRDFETVAIRLQKNGEDSYEMQLEDGVPQFEPLQQLNSFVTRLPIRGGYDHPNEVAAYLFTVITHGDEKPRINEEATEVLQSAIEWFKQHLQKNDDQETTKGAHDED